VSANSRLRAALVDRGEGRDTPTFLPSVSLSTDNAAMIAAAGLRAFRAGVTASLDLKRGRPRSRSAESLALRLSDA